MPGVFEDGVEITLETNVLTLHGRVTHTGPASEELGDLAPELSEYEIGDSRRTFTLSNEIEFEKCATCLNDSTDNASSR
jgi:HSP20 family molecular chaperone IbpA